MKNKLISLSIILMLIFTTVISADAIAKTPRIDLNEYQYKLDKISDINIQGTVSIGVGQMVGLYDVNGKILYSYTTVNNSNSKESFTLVVPSRYMVEGVNTFKVKSLPIKNIINGSNPKTITINISSSKKNQIINANNLSLNVGEKKNINATVNSNLSLTYKSDNTDIATVDSTGNIIGRNAGTTNIVISQSGNSEYNSVTKKISVTVKSTTPVTTKEYTITFDANYGTGKMTAQKVKSNTSIKLRANTFKRPYYKFAGWAESRNGKVKYKNTAVIKATKNTTLYAKWTADWKKPNGKVAEGKSPKAGIGYGSMKYKKGSHTRGIICVVRANDPGLALAIADNAVKITDNNKIGYSTSSNVGPKLYKQLIKKGSKKASGKASCSPFALCCLKYSMYMNPEYKFATADKYGINCNWRSDSRTNIKEGLISVKKKIGKSGKKCPYTLIYDKSKFKNWKSQLRRGDIAICAHHVFVIL